MIFSLKTEWPIAIDSPDNINCWGVYRDCSVSEQFFVDIEKYFKRSCSLLDLGSAGSGLTNQAIERGHISCSLEGSDYWLRENRLDGDTPQAKIWKQYLNKNVFTCDISHNFELSDYYDPEHKIYQFDVITMWEVFEHIFTDRLETTIENIKKHLKHDGVFVGSISLINDAPLGIELHKSIFTAQQWMDILSPHFIIEENRTFTKVRNENNSLHILLRK